MAAMASAPLGWHAGRNALRPDEVRSDDGAKPHHVPLLVLILTEQQNSARRAWQRKTWLGWQWKSSLNTSQRGLVPWRFVYFLALSDNRTAGATDELVGEMVTLHSVRESYLSLVYKTMAALHWAHTRLSFDVLLKTDDDSIVHISRLWEWLCRRQHAPAVARAPAHTHTALAKEGRLYAGRVQRDSQVIRPTFSRKDLWHPEWYPPDFLKWAVPSAAYPGVTYPPHCSGGGYLLGRHAVERVLRANRTRREDVFYIEDAYVGVLAQSGGLVPTDLSGLMQDPPRGQLQVAATFAQQILVHRVPDANAETAFGWLLGPGGAAPATQRRTKRRFLSGKMARGGLLA